ncbi:hypothetical protein H5U35_04055 [Candidatus Aerophobetes bacterium]|nr:hypothetical protein [Candidatus Aerophobetes bacterium]
MKIKSFEFSIRELAGSMGDFGTLFPLAVGYIAVCGLNPTGFLVMMGAVNIATGLIYRLPMPLQPMKVLAVMAIAQKWSPSMVYASAFGMGIIWTFFAATGLMELIARFTPTSVTRGIQVALGILLAIQALKMIFSWWLVGLISIAIVLFLRENRYAPASIVLMILGFLVIAVKGRITQISLPGFNFPPLTGFTLQEVWQTLVLAGFAQLPLTATNAVIATSALIKKYFPEKPVSEKKLSLNMGLMNLVSPFFGGMPMCHGAGGLAGQYYFGARTGGTNIIEGTIEIFLGLFLGFSVASLFSFFPSAIIGGMMVMVGVELCKFAKDINFKKTNDIFPFAITVIISVITNMAFGFAVGITLYHLLRFFLKR